MPQDDKEKTAAELAPFKALIAKLVSDPDVRVQTELLAQALQAPPTTPHLGLQEMKNLSHQQVKDLSHRYGTHRTGNDLEKNFMRFIETKMTALGYQGFDDYNVTQISESVEAQLGHPSPHPSPPRPVAMPLTFLGDGDHRSFVAPGDTPKVVPPHRKKHETVPR